MGPQKGWCQREASSAGFNSDPKKPEGSEANILRNLLVECNYFGLHHAFYTHTEMSSYWVVIFPLWYFFFRNVSRCAPWILLSMPQVSPWGSASPKTACLCRPSSRLSIISWSTCWLQGLSHSYTANLPEVRKHRKKHDKRAGGPYNSWTHVHTQCFSHTATLTGRTHAQLSKPLKKGKIIQDKQRITFIIHHSFLHESLLN